MNEKETPKPFPVISIDELRKIDDRPARTIPVPAWGRSVVVREPDVRTDTMIIKSATKTIESGGKEKSELDNEDFAVKQILEGFVNPKLGPEDYDMVKGWGASTNEYLVTQIRNRKKNELSTN